MPTFVKRAVNNRVLIQVVVEATTQSDNRFMALVDTGAARTAVTSRLVDQVGAVPAGPGSFLPASGQPVDTSLFAIHLAIPVESHTPDGETLTFASGKRLIVFQLPYQPKDYDVVLGMDMLTHYHITMHDGSFIMSN